MNLNANAYFKFQSIRRGFMLMLLLLFEFKKSQNKLLFQQVIHLFDLNKNSIFDLVKQEIKHLFGFALNLVNKKALEKLR